MANKKDKGKFSEEYIKKHRKFPVGNTVLLAILIAAQIFLIIGMIIYKPTPKDRIDSYEITVTPLSDGTLDIEYVIVWTALDEEEPLSGVEIGMPNESYRLLSYSDNVNSASPYSDDSGYISLRLSFKTFYVGGETVKFSFKINQPSLLCSTSDSYFYELVPCWFNSIPVEHYRFTWKAPEQGKVTASNADKEHFSELVWEGSLDCGEYVPMKVEYSSDTFSDAQTVTYVPFDSEGAYNGLNDEKVEAVFFMLLLFIVLAIFEVMIIDSYISYRRGRGFISSDGHYLHLYGRSNPNYPRSGGKGGGFRGGGCACACACACAGGGRAGCSQKDTYKPKRETNNDQNRPSAK